MTQVDLAIALGSALAVTDVAAPQLMTGTDRARYRTYFAALLYTALALEPINTFFLTRWFDWNTTYMLDPASVSPIIFTVAVLVALVVMTLLGVRLGIWCLSRGRRNWVRIGWIAMAGWTILWNLLFLQRAVRVGTYADWQAEQAGTAVMPKIWETARTPFLTHFLVVGVLFAAALVAILLYVRRGGAAAGREQV